jgi:hypothetical protein
MGFKDLVARNSHDRIYELMKKVSEAIQSTKAHFSMVRNKDGKEEVLVTMTMYSDSIMVYSKDASYDSLSCFVGTIASLTDDLFLEKIPHKGAVAYGKMTLDFNNSIFFGQPLIDAYLLQEELNFYGIVAHASIEYKSGFKTDLSVYNYLCPFKNGAAHHYTIAPITFFSPLFSDKEYNILVKSISNLGMKTSGSLRKYIGNTTLYVDFLRTEIKKRIILNDKKEKIIKKS